jgi:hypothetical protein
VEKYFTFWDLKENIENFLKIFSGKTKNFMEPMVSHGPIDTPSPTLGLELTETPSTWPLVSENVCKLQQDLVGVSQDSDTLRFGVFGIREPVLSVHQWQLLFTT